MLYYTFTKLSYSYSFIALAAVVVASVHTYSVRLFLWENLASHCPRRRAAVLCGCFCVTPMAHRALAVIVAKTHPLVVNLESGVMLCVTGFGCYFVFLSLTFFFILPKNIFKNPFCTLHKIFISCVTLLIAGTLFYLIPFGEYHSDTLVHYSF